MTVGLARTTSRPLDSPIVEENSVPIELTDIDKPFLQYIGDIRKPLRQLQSRLQDQQKSESEKEKKGEDGEKGGNRIG
jgi:hypothetical protein